MTRRTQHGRNEPQTADYPCDVLVLLELASDTEEANRGNRRSHRCCRLRWGSGAGQGPSRAVRRRRREAGRAQGDARAVSAQRVTGSELVQCLEPANARRFEALQRLRHGGEQLAPTRNGPSSILPAPAATTAVAAESSPRPSITACPLWSIASCAGACLEGWLLACHAKASPWIDPGLIRVLRDRQPRVL